MSRLPLRQSRTDSQSLRPRRLAKTSLTILLLCATFGCANNKITSTPPEPQLIERNQLLVCTSLPYEPFEFRQGGQVVGFDIDMVNEVADALGVEAVFIDQDFERIQSGELFNEEVCDVGVAALTITGGRARVVDFSSPYFDSTQVLIVRRGSNIRNLQSLGPGSILAVQEGTTSEIYAKDHAPAATQILRYDNLEEVNKAVGSGEVDGAIYGNNLVPAAVKRRPNLKAAAEFNTGEQVGMAVKKDGDIALLRVINNLLADIQEDGRYDTIYNKWFGDTPR